MPEWFWWVMAAPVVAVASLLALPVLVVVAAILGGIAAVLIALALAAWDESPRWLRVLGVVAIGIVVGLLV